MPRHRRIKIALIGVAVASLLCITIAYVAAYQATARSQGPNTVIVLYEQSIPRSVESGAIIFYLLPCDASHVGYIAVIGTSSDTPPPDPREDMWLRVPTAPPCP